MNLSEYNLHCPLHPDGYQSTPERWSLA